MRLVIASALLLASAPAFAAPAETHSFVRDGETYEYVAERTPSGLIKLAGHSVGNDTPFALTVRARRVTGYMGTQPVDFLVSADTRTRLDAEVQGPVTTASAM